MRLLLYLRLLQEALARYRVPIPENPAQAQQISRKRKKKTACKVNVVRVSNKSPPSFSLKNPHRTPPLPPAHIQKKPTPWVSILLKGNRRNALSSLLEGLLPVVHVPRQRPISLTGSGMVKGGGGGGGGGREAYCVL